MLITNDSTTVNELFFQPLEHALANATNLWPCPEFPDDVWMHMGVQRVLEASEEIFTAVLLSRLTSTGIPSAFFGSFSEPNFMFSFYVDKAEAST